MDWPFKPTINKLETLRQPLRKSVLTSFPGNSDAQHNLRIAINQGPQPPSWGLATPVKLAVALEEIKRIINLMSLFKSFPTLQSVENYLP